MAKPCSDCGSEFVVWAHSQKRDKSWGPMLFDSVPGGKFQSYEIESVGGKATAKFVLNKDQTPGKNYYAAHYKTCTAKGGEGATQGPPPAPKPLPDGPVHVVVTIGNTVYEGVLTEKLPF